MVEQSSVARGNLNLLQSQIVDKINFVSMLKCSDNGKDLTMINISEDS